MVPHLSTDTPPPACPLCFCFRELTGCFCFSFPWSFLPLNIPLPACSCTCLLSGPPVCLGLPLQSPLLPLIPPVRDGLTPFPPTVPRATATPTPNTFPAEPRAPSIASDVLPGAKPSRLSLWGPWAGPGPILSPTSTESPLQEKPLPPEPPTTPGTTVHRPLLSFCHHP